MPVRHRLGPTKWTYICYIKQYRAYFTSHLTHPTLLATYICTYQLHTYIISIHLKNLIMSEIQRLPVSWPCKSLYFINVATVICNYVTYVHMVCKC